MSSLKDFDNYRVVVFTMDDIVFNLNQIRYDFSQLLYPSAFKNMTYHEYAMRLGTVQSMYSFLDTDSISSVNDKIESYLYSEKNLRNIKVNENIEAVFNLLKSKNIKIVLFTTHSSKRAKQLLQYKGLLSQIDQVVSISEFSETTPSIKLFHTIIDLYSTNHYELLVVSSLNSIFKCIRYSPIDSVYVQMTKLTCLEPSLKATAMVSSLFELLQYILFGKYTATKMYNDFLGYDDNMSDEEKRSRYEYLKIKYNDSPELMPIVDEVFSENNEIQFGDFNTQEFRFHFSKLSQNNNEPILKQEELFNDNNTENTLIQTKTSIPIDHTQSMELFESEDTKEFEFNFDDSLDNQATSIQPMDPEVSNILKDINHEDSHISNEFTSLDDNYDDSDDKNNAEKIYNIIISGLMNFINAFLFVSIVGLLYMSFETMINSQWIVKAFCDMFIIGYTKLCFILFDAIPILPDSTQLLSGTTVLFNQFLVIILCTFLILSVISIFKYFTNED